MSTLNKQFFVGNRKALIEASGAKLVVIAANGLLQRSYSTKYRFQQDSNFYYLTGVNEPNILLVIDAENNEEFYISAPTTEVGEIFDGVASQSKMAKISGVPRLYSHDGGWLKLEKLIAKHKVVHTVEAPDSFIDVYSMFTNPARAHLIKRLKKSGARVNKLGQHFAELRVIKQPQEIAVIRQAINATAVAFKCVANNINHYNYEYEVQADMEATFLKETQSDPAYESIVASGKNACTLHYIENSAEIDKTKPLLIDAGAQSRHYASDITRVFLPKDARAKQVHQAVQSLQQAAYKIIKPGLDFIDYERAMVARYGDALVELGVISKPTEKLIRKYMPHATSHFLGLDVHDAGDYYQSFKPGMVITVEPGLYLPKEQIGIRIEDNVLITNTGIEVLSSFIPTQLNFS